MARDGTKTGGRIAGTPNKTTTAAKDAIQQCFEDIGGILELSTWAKVNRDKFYTQIWPKILPLKLVGDPDDPLHIVSRIERHVIDKNDSPKD